MASDVRELISLCKRYPNQKIHDIHIEGFFGRYTNCNFHEKDSLNKIDMATFRLKNVDENSGWICDAHWKSLKNIYIYEEYVGTDLNYLPNYFLNNKWRPIMPQLKVVVLELRNIPFHYCSLMSLLTKSPDLDDLTINLEAENAKIEDFDIMEFNIEMKKRQLKLELVKLTNKCRRPIIPFESFMDLIHASPNIEKVSGNFNSYEELMLKKEYTVLFEDDWNIDDFPIILNIND